jgi:orotate phosphoribosyltransferase
MAHGERIAEFLLSIGAVRLSVGDPFTWVTGLRAPIYCDCRMIYSHPAAREVVVSALTDCVRNLHIEPDVIAGTATAAIGWAALVADRLDLPFVYVRSKAKEHGTRKLIEGDLPPEKHCVVIEDLISTGSSTAFTAETLRSEAKAIVTDVVSLFSYNLLAARERAMESHLLFHPLATIDVLLPVAIAQDRISKEESDEIRRFVRDPEQWHKTR